MDPIRQIVTTFSFNLRGVLREVEELIMGTRPIQLVLRDRAFEVIRSLSAGGAISDQTASALLGQVDHFVRLERRIGRWGRTRGIGFDQTWAFQRVYRAFGRAIPKPRRLEEAVIRMTRMGLLGHLGELSRTLEVVERYWQGSAGISRSLNSRAVEHVMRVWLRMGSRTLGSVRTIGNLALGPQRVPLLLLGAVGLVGGFA